jgi:hypothetical protein
MIDTNLNLLIRRVKVNCQITKLKQKVMPTYDHIDSTDTGRITTPLLNLDVTLSNYHGDEFISFWQVIIA